MEFAQCFRLSDAPGTGVRCDEGGMSVGATPLLERATGARDRGAGDHDRSRISTAMSARRMGFRSRAPPSPLALRASPTR